MKLFKVEEGALINCDNIESLEPKDLSHTKICMRSGKKFTANYSCRDLAKIIDDISDSSEEESKKLLNIAKTIGNFSG